MTTEKEQPRPATSRWIYLLLLGLVLLAGGYLRISGLFWGEYTYLHPDERFLIWVGSDIAPVGSFQEYWDTTTSTLNPHNRNHGFYVYGTLPMFLARYVVDWVYGRSGFMEMLHVGRSLSALFDLATVFLVFLLASALYDRRVGLLAAAFSSFAVLPIQQSHFFTMDTFTTFFAVLVIYFAVRVGKADADPERGEAVYENGDVRHALGADFAPEAANAPARDAEPFALSAGLRWQIGRFTSQPLFLLSLGFGVALGMAVASKVNAAPLALLLPAAMLVRLAGTAGQDRRRQFLEAGIFLAVAALISLLVFRIFQPYAFSGPGFFGLRPNPAWIDNLRSLASQTGGDVDFPPAMQWARRPVWFAWQNMVLWGMGLPLGLLAWAGFIWAGWEMLKGDWRNHALIWGWTALYFTWQSLVFNPSMRYQLLVYPTLVIFGAWGFWKLYDRSRSNQEYQSRVAGHPWSRILALTLGMFALLSTAAYAFAFTSIYTRPMTRVEASRWIYQNIPGPINLHIETENGLYNQPLPFPYEYAITPDLPFHAQFRPQVDGVLGEVYLPSVQDRDIRLALESLDLTILTFPEGGEPIARASPAVALGENSVHGRPELGFSFDQPVLLLEEQSYQLKIHLPVEASVNLCGPLVLEIKTADEIARQELPPANNCVLSPDNPYQATFVAGSPGSLLGIYLEQAGIERTSSTATQLGLVLSDQPDMFVPLAIATVPIDLSAVTEAANGGALFRFEHPVAISGEKTYYLELVLQSETGAIYLKGAAIANEGAWDDGLPVRLDGYDAFGGIYQPGLNFDMYETDNPRKLARFLSVLDQSEYLLISSSRQWGSLPRLPERFPMTTEYYRHLLGCPVGRSIEWCYNVASPGDFQGELGFELVKTFHSKPSLGSLSINDQFAEEAFTVYDHPKVFIFKKTEDYDSLRAREILGAVDLDKVVHVTPKKAGPLPRDMMLPAERLQGHLAGGTWSDIFNTDAIYNRWPALGLVVWYLAVAFLGLLAYPIVRVTLSGLPDRGYPLARTAGLLLVSYLVWVLGSLNLPFTRLTVSLVVVSLAVGSSYLAYQHKDQLRQEWRTQRRYFLLIECLFLAFFIFGLLLRLGNPDLWHPWKGGEKPMDFSYFNAVLRSSSFPPYDPWFAGGYINYYYYGFVLVGVLVKWLGIVPSIAFNLILPTIFSLIALGAFSLGWNLVSGRLGLSPRPEVPPSDQRIGESEGKRASGALQLWVGLAAAFGMAVLGNLGTVRMLYHGFQKLAAPGGTIEGAGLLTRWSWTFQGFLQAALGKTLPYGISDWYWIPSRAIPAPGEIEPITEFPFFTFLYADRHAHLFALPLSLLALSWAVSIVLVRAWRPRFPDSPPTSKLHTGLSLLFGGLAIGVLRPTNTWDLPTYLALGVVALGYSIWRYYCPERSGISTFRALAPAGSRLLIAAGGIFLLVGLAFFLFQPFGTWYVAGYTAVDLWEGSRTPFWSYLTHWGLFLFVIVSWMAWETRDWLANTPLSALHKLQPYRAAIQATLLTLFIAVLALLFFGVSIAWLVLPLAFWAGVLLFRPGTPDIKRIVLFLIGTGLVLTLVVEVLVLRGDVARMNTVFKFYLQVWTLFAVSAAASLGWLLAALPGWKDTWRFVWRTTLVLLITGAALYPLVGSAARIKDRMAPHAPRTLDGMVYMKYATYHDLNTAMDLSQDYRAIRWLQENVVGTPVIVEANMPEYHWGTRFTIYTGLPNVVGWNWHQRQQRALTSEQVWERVNAVNEFYLTSDVEAVQVFLQEYGVRYILLGQLERAYYPGSGLDKFEQFDGLLWKAVYRDGETVIYEVTG